MGRRVLERSASAIKALLSSWWGQLLLMVFLAAVPVRWGAAWSFVPVVPLAGYAGIKLFGMIGQIKKLRRDSRLCNLMCEFSKSNWIVQSDGTWSCLFEYCVRNVGKDNITFLYPEIICSDERILRHKWGVEVVKKPDGVSFCILEDTLREVKRQSWPASKYELVYWIGISGVGLRPGEELRYVITLEIRTTKRFEKTPVMLGTMTFYPRKEATLLMSVPASAKLELLRFRVVDSGGRLDQDEYDKSVGAFPYRTVGGRPYGPFPVLSMATCIWLR